jgi:heme iron utilization protein
MNRQSSGSRPTRRMTLEEMLTAFGALRFAVLATSDRGRPYATLIAFALTPDRHTLIFTTSKATSKYKNIKNQPAVSLLLDNCSQHEDDLRNAHAVTLLGTAKEVRTTAQKAEYRVIFVERHPELTAFIDEPGTALIAVTIRKAVHVEHFQNISVWP